MNPRERILALILLAAVILGGGGLVLYQFFWSPLRNRDSVIADMESKILTKEKAVEDLKKKKDMLEQWRALTLPNGPTGSYHLALGEYQKYLNELLAESNLGAVTIQARAPDNSASARGKKPVFLKLTYDLNGPASPPNLLQV